MATDRRGRYWTPEVLALVERWRQQAAEATRDREARRLHTEELDLTPCLECGAPIEDDSPAAPTLCTACAFVPASERSGGDGG